MSSLRILGRSTRILGRAPGGFNKITALSVNQTRSVTTTNKLWKHEDLPGHNDEHQGTMARTDKEIQVEHPPEEELPSSKPYRGRGGIHNRRTLASFSLEGRVGVVTGGARGLGLVMAQALVISGADVALVDLNKEEGLKQAEEIVDHFRQENPDATRMPKVTAHYSNVSDPESVGFAVHEIIKEHGKIDHLVTSAGFTENFDAIEYPHERIKKLWGVNVDGSYLFATAVGRHLMERKSKGSIVMVGSMSGAVVNVPQPQAPYNASKAAVRQLAASLAVEWAHAGIRVNCISPGYMMTALSVNPPAAPVMPSALVDSSASVFAPHYAPTSMPLPPYRPAFLTTYRTRKIMDDKPDLKRQWTSLIPQGQMGSPADLMGAVVYLLSDAAAYTTGADLRIDGGYTVT